ncbi:MAG: hypothetical protein NkDv07_0109 [Candidatus Improbicoccus devescovinae]|nr:MAG: hypothetical protein NkDv07_0109 [Candidatus Improbicoccus devescovinae]
MDTTNVKFLCALPFLPTYTKKDLAKTEIGKRYTKFLPLSTDVIFEKKIKYKGKSYFGISFNLELNTEGDTKLNSESVKSLINAQSKANDVKQKLIQNSVIWLQVKILDGEFVIDEKYKTVKGKKDEQPSLVVSGYFKAKFKKIKCLLSTKEAIEKKVGIPGTLVWPTSGDTFDYDLDERITTMKSLFVQMNVGSNPYCAIVDKSDHNNIVELKASAKNGLVPVPPKGWALLGRAKTMLQKLDFLNVAGENKLKESISLLDPQDVAFYVVRNRLDYRTDGFLYRLKGSQIKVNGTQTINMVSKEVAKQAQDPDKHEKPELIARIEHDITNKIKFASGEEYRGDSTLNEILKAYKAKRDANKESENSQEPLALIIELDKSIVDEIGIKPPTAITEIIVKRQNATMLTVNDDQGKTLINWAKEIGNQVAQKLLEGLEQATITDSTDDITYNTKKLLERKGSDLTIGINDVKKPVYCLNDRTHEQTQVLLELEEVLGDTAETYVNSRQPMAVNSVNVASASPIATVVLGGNTKGTVAWTQADKVSDLTKRINTKYKKKLTEEDVWAALYRWYRVQWKSVKDGKIDTRGRFFNQFKKPDKTLSALVEIAANTNPLRHEKIELYLEFTSVTTENQDPPTSRASDAIYTIFHESSSIIEKSNNYVFVKKDNTATVLTYTAEAKQSPTDAPDNGFEQWFIYGKNNNKLEKVRPNKKGQASFCAHYEVAKGILVVYEGADINSRPGLLKINDKRGKKPTTTPHFIVMSNQTPIATVVASILSVEPTKIKISPKDKKGADFTGRHLVTIEVTVKTK